MQGIETKNEFLSLIYDENMFSLSIRKYGWFLVLAVNSLQPFGLFSPFCCKCAGLFQGSVNPLVKLRRYFAMSRFSFAVSLLCRKHILFCCRIFNLYVRDLTL